MPFSCWGLLCIWFINISDFLPISELYESFYLSDFTNTESNLINHNFCFNFNIRFFQFENGYLSDSFVIHMILYE